jgi:hypothetical protein
MITGHPETLPGVEVVMKKPFRAAVRGLARIGPGEFTGFKYRR